MDIRNKLQIMIDDTLLETTYNKDNNTIFLPKDYDLSYLLTIIKKYSFPSLKILSTPLITKEVLEAISNNQRISSITLGSSNDPYTLTREVFDLLNASDSLFNIDTNYVEGNYNTREMEYLSFFRNSKVGQYTISDLFVLDSFHFYQPLSEEEMLSISKYMKSFVSIYFEYGNYDNIVSIIKTLAGKNIVFNIREFEHIEDYFQAFGELLHDKEKIYVMESMNLDKYIYLSSYLEMMVKDIKEANLSSFEKYLAVYEIVTHFKKYLDNPDNLSDARILEYVLFNHYIVCKGFSELFVALLDKVGIKAYDVDVEFYKDKEEVTLSDYARLTKEEIKVKLGNVSYHSRVLVHLVDPKYQIDGIFMADPTWDNDLEHHYFNHALMLPHEMNFEKEKFYETDVSIFDVQSSAMFLEKINKLPNALNYFLEVLKQIDFHYYEYLRKKYDFDVHDSGFLLDVYNYIIMHTTKGISKEIKENALSNLFHFIDSDLDPSYLGEILDENMNRDQDCFKKGMR